jgi:hypothetical protein
MVASMLLSDTDLLNTLVNIGDTDLLNTLVNIGEKVGVTGFLGYMIWWMTRVLARAIHEQTHALTRQSEQLSNAITHIERAHSVQSRKLDDLARLIESRARTFRDSDRLIGDES